MPEESPLTPDLISGHLQFLQQALHQALAHAGRELPGPSCPRVALSQTASLHSVPSVRLCPGALHIPFLTDTSRCPNAARYTFFPLPSPFLFPSPLSSFLGSHADKAGLKLTTQQRMALNL